MALDRVKLQDIVASQLPSYVVDDFPLLPEFLQQYYVSQEFQSGPVDILKNIDQYVKVDELFNLRNSTILVVICHLLIRLSVLRQLPELTDRDWET